MEARKKRFEDLNLSRDELNVLGEAFKNDEFRNLLGEYCKEVTDPENVKLYQQEITELERQRGVDVTFINPEPGFVIKTSADGKQKAYINVSKSPNVAKPAPRNRDGCGSQWSIPYSIAPPREEFDNQKKICMVVDVVFHPETLILAGMRKQFREVVIQTALDGVEQHCRVTLDRANLKFPKLGFKGFSRGAVIRKNTPNFVPSEEDEEFVNQIPNPYKDGGYFAEKAAEPASPPPPKAANPQGYATPKYDIKYRNYIDIQDFTYDVKSKANAAIPKEVVVSIELPLLKSSTEPTLKLDIEGTSVSLICEKPKYKLNLTLPYNVDGDSGKADFVKDSRKLVITLPVKQHLHISKDVLLEDSGVESDPGSRPDEADSDEQPSKTSDVLSEESEHSEECSGEFGYRTSKSVQPPSVCDTFLSEDLHYSLPHFTCNSFDNTFALTLHVKNVDEKSICQRVLAGKRGLHLAFASVGGGMFPQHFALCVAFPEGLSVNENSVVIEAWDNNVIAQFKLDHSGNLPNEYYVGVQEEDLKPFPLTELLQVEKAVTDLHETGNQATTKVTVEVQRDSADEVVVELTPCSPNQPTEPSVSPKTKTEEAEKSVGETKVENKIKPDEVSPPNNHSKPVPPKGRKLHTRGLSESSGDDWVQKNIVRGILKRPSRSLSESNLDEYVLSDIPSSAIGSEECIASENCETCAEDHATQKKTVRFSDNIGRKIFRVNSSILGKKNKLRRKKRAPGRRVSDGDNSEGEVTESDLRSGIIKKKSKSDSAVNISKSPRLSESTEDEDHHCKRVESSEEERDKADRESKVTRSRRRRHHKNGGRS